MTRLNVVIVGAGMYVCGRGTDGYGTIMPALLEWSNRGLLGEISIATTKCETARTAKRKIDGLMRRMGKRADIRYYPTRKHSGSPAYINAIKDTARPAACIIAVPDHLHCKIGGAAINAGFHTLIAKPMTSTLSEGLKLIGLQRKKDVYCAVEFHKRLDQANMMLRDVIHSGKIGEPLYAVVEYSQRRNVPLEHFRSWAERTNVFQYLGVHYADILYFATSAKPVRAMATGQMGYLFRKGLKVHDSIQAAIEWVLPSRRKFVSHIMTNWVDPDNTTAMSDQAIKVIGTKGRFESDQKRRGITIVTDDSGAEEPNPYFCASYSVPGKARYSGYGIDSICQFLDDALSVEMGETAIKDLEMFRPTFKQSLISTAVVEAVNRSLKRGGRWVGVKGI